MMSTKFWDFLPTCMLKAGLRKKCLTHLLICFYMFFGNPPADIFHGSPTEYTGFRLFIGSKAQCLFYFEICTTEGKKREGAQFSK